RGRAVRTPGRDRRAPPAADARGPRRSPAHPAGRRAGDAGPAPQEGRRLAPARRIGARAGRPDPRLQPLAGGRPDDAGGPPPALARASAGRRRPGGARHADSPRPTGADRHPRHRHRHGHPAAARGPAGEPQGDALGRFPPRRAPGGGRPRVRAHPMSPVLRAGAVSQARYEALHLLVRVERDRAFADIALEHALERARLDPRDAALFTEIVFGTLRWRRHLDWRLTPHADRALAKLDPWVRALLRLTAYQLIFLDRAPRWAAGDEAVSVARLKSRVPGPAEFVNAVLRSFTRAPSPPRLPALPVEAAGVRWSFPDWMAARWIDRYGMEEAERLMAALDERPPVTIRANTLRVRREDLAARLRDEELAETDPTTLAPEGLTVRR